MQIEHVPGYKVFAIPYHNLPGECIFFETLPKARGGVYSSNSREIKEISAALALMTILANLIGGVFSDRERNPDAKNKKKIYEIVNSTPIVSN